MADEFGFDPTLKKKKKKKTVQFTEDPLGADADPTTPAPPPAAEDGPTVHEQMKMNGKSFSAEETVPKPEEDPMAMFGDLKKKKKKKEIPLDLEHPAQPAKGEDPVEPEPDFDLIDLKKKKKKKEIPLDLETQAAEEEADIDLPELKKKKKKKEIPLDLETQAEDAPADEEAGFDLSDLKKRKKKSSKKAALDMEAFEKELGAANDGDDGGADDDDDFGADDLGDDPFATEAVTGAHVNGLWEPGKEPWAGSDRDYKYPELLSRFFSMLHAANPALANNMGKRYTIAPPQILREGNKKSIFANLPDICRRMHRQPEHLISFMFAEMGTTGSVDGSGRLVIKGRFLQKQIENVLRRYIVEYVTCKTCKSPDTILTKENRIYFMACESCGSRRSVSAIKSGFQAQVGKRSRNKTG